MPLLLSDRDAPRVEAAVLAHETGAGQRPREHRGGRNPHGRSPIRGILLEDLESESVADVAVTELFESTEVQEVSLVGGPVSGNFKLKFKTNTTSDIPWNATAAQVQTALENLESIGKGNVRVTLGKMNDFTPNVWLVTFRGVFAGIDVPLLEPSNTFTGTGIVVAASTEWVDTGEIDQVRCIIPVGVPTPIRAGAVVAAIEFPGAGMGVIAAECREFKTQEFSPYGS